MLPWLFLLGSTKYCTIYVGHVILACAAYTVTSCPISCLHGGLLALDAATLSLWF